MHEAALQLLQTSSPSLVLSCVQITHYNWPEATVHELPKFLLSALSDQKSHTLLRLHFENLPRHRRLEATNTAPRLADCTYQRLIERSASHLLLPEAPRFLSFVETLLRRPISGITTPLSSSLPSRASTLQRTLTSRLNFRSISCIGTSNSSLPRSTVVRPFGSATPSCL